jgi:transketolase
MRDEFIRTLTALARQDRNVMLVTGDLGFGVLTNFWTELPAQFVNAGVAEQNMTGLAAGMALEGKTVFTYSIANFPTLRCLEQIRNDACYHGAAVKVVAIGGGFSYGSLGITHHATEDLAIMRSLPDITVVAPGDPLEVAAATRAIAALPGTCYLRLGRGGEPHVHQGDIDFALGKAIRLYPGGDIAIFATGAILKPAADARAALQAAGYDTALYSMHTLKPLDRDAIAAAARSAKLIVTVEEHSVIGGLGGAVAEVLAQLPGPKAGLKIIGLEAGFSSVVGDQEYLRGIYGLSAEAIVRTVKQAWADYK